MARTFGADLATGDITGEVIDGLEALRQRVVQRLRWRRGTWFFAPAAGTPPLMGHEHTRGIIARVITDTIRDEGGPEITDIIDVQTSIDTDNRVLNYSARVLTIYGDTEITETLRAS